jgi:starvation-inducible outer membrane lipoprotein
MKAYIVMIRIGNKIERHIVAARSAEGAATISRSRFGGVVLNVLAD